ncbi:MAG: hypothetical protein ABI664_16900, partial [bacterium]
PVFCHKMPVYAPHRDPSLRESASTAAQTLPESSMSRRQISFVIVALASLVVSACGTSPTAPSREEIVVVGSG